MRAEILSVGTELLLGQIVDTNAAYLAGRLSALGIDCLWISTVGDNLGRAQETFARALERSDLVVATGGLGPTEDDLTREAIAAAVGEAPAVDAGLERELEEWFARRGMPMPERNRKQAWLIPSARALPNPNGTAPGWWVEARGRIVVAMPGVPREMTRMWEVEVEPRLPRGAPIRSRTLKLLGIGESAVEEALGELVRSTAPTLATYAKADGVHIRITDKDLDAARRDARIETMERTVRGRLGAHVWGTDAETLPEVVGRGLLARGWRLATAEALTGGELARTLSEADHDGWYAGGVVRPGASAEELADAAATIRADVLVIVPHGEAESTVHLRAPDRDRRSTFHFASPAEARRRGMLGSLDLLRRALAETVGGSGRSPLR